MKEACYPFKILRWELIVEEHGVIKRITPESVREEQENFKRATKQLQKIIGEKVDV